MSLEDLRNIEAGLTLDDDNKPVAANRIQVKTSVPTKKAKKKKNKAKKKKNKAKKKKQKEEETPKRWDRFENLMKQMAEKRKKDKEDGRLTRRERKRSAS
jgi:hypothetical protein